jgi:hypothetical protein
MMPQKQAAPVRACSKGDSQIPCVQLLEEAQHPLCPRRRRKIIALLVDRTREGGERISQLFRQQGYLYSVP